jgi:hypothetical protein
MCVVTPFYETTSTVCAWRHGALAWRRHHEKPLNVAALINFVNPGLLGCIATFKRVFGDPIMRSRDREATPEEADLGQRRSEELNRRVQAFVLRRTKDVNAAYLPPLTSFVVLCLPSPLQVHAL